MIYIFDENTGKERFTLKGEQHKYLVKVRRHQVGDKLFFRNKESLEQLYTYEIVDIEPRSVSFALVKVEESLQKPKKELHIAWCVIDPKSVEKVLASLCEIGVSRISFVDCERSQSNFKPDMKRLERIVEASMQQSGRSTLMSFDTYKSIEVFLQEFPDTQIFDFCEQTLSNSENIQRVLIGCEGGFSEKERALFKSENVFRFESTNVLRSESAALGIAAKVLL